jgi:plastocyanin
MHARLARFAMGAALLLTACGGGGGSTTPSTNPPANQPPAGQTGTTITIPAGDGYGGSSSFSPGSLTVAPGTTVTWMNRDGVVHVTESGTVWSANLEPGGSFSHTFATRGTFNYRCSIHTGMSGSVTVQ